MSCKKREEEKPFGLGIIVGRFQVLHKGHGFMIRKALAVCSQVAVFIGSSQESGTLKNPLTYEMRAGLIREVFPEVSVFPLPDIGVGNTFAWGDYVLKNVKKHCGEMPELIISGYETRRTEWIDEKWKVSLLSVPKIIDMSATKMIRFMLEDDRENWTENIEPAIAGKYDMIREYVLRSSNNLETMSI